MKLIAILENKQRRLRALLPEFVSPFDIFMTRYCSVHDELNENNDSRYICPHAGNNCHLVDVMKTGVDIHMLVQTDVQDATDFEGVAKNKDGFIVACFSVKTLMSRSGSQIVTPETTWSEFLGRFTTEQLHQAVSILPIPSMIVDRKGKSTTGSTVVRTKANDPLIKIFEWSYPTGSTYLNFNQNYKRPTAYTLDNLPGIEAHYGSHLYPDFLDRPHMITKSLDIAIKKDASCPVNLDNSLAIANGLLYYSGKENNQYYIYGATDVFVNQVFPYASVMLLDFSEIVQKESIQKTLFKDCIFDSVTDIGMEYEIIFSVPDTDLFKKSVFVSFDGRLMRLDRYSIIGNSTIKLTVSKSEILHMRERDMQLTEKVAFGSRFIHIPDNTEDWIKGQFGIFSDAVINSTNLSLEEEIFSWEKMSDEEKEILLVNAVFGSSGGNVNRSFVCVLPVDNVYVHEYAFNSRVNYNGLLLNGYVEGVLQSTRGQEIFEHVICKFMNLRKLTPTDFQTWVNGPDSVFTKTQTPLVYMESDASNQSEYNPEVESTAYEDYTCDKVIGIIEAIEKQENTDIVTSITVNGIVYVKKETQMHPLLYGTYSHLIGYKPYEFLTTLDSQSGYKNDPDTTFLSTPYIDRIAREAVKPNSMEFRLLDIVKM